MINAKEVRNRLHLSEKIEIKDMAMKYFENELNKVLQYIDNDVGPFGLTFSFSLKNILNLKSDDEYKIETIKLTKENIEKNMISFVKELEDLGYFVQWKYDSNLDSYIFAVYWVSIL